jgi:F0F1-type ATP synthase assembly protein I
VSGERNRPSLPAELGRYLGAGLTWTLSTLLFLWVGWRVDAWLGTRPVATLVGAFVGAGAGLYWMVRQLQPPNATGGEDREESRKE